MREFKTIEKYSSSITLSDMEIFVFPELLYALVLANIMSPLIWEWRSDPWFDEIESMNEYRRILRIKQFIMNRFVFNLDLDTWGLTNKKTEIDRFSKFSDVSLLSQSNALFGYEGDKYYFDIDIRKHFGLDKYDSDIIPYWKTETIEAMEAFKFKPDYPSGAGECVSLSTLYSAALFVIGKIELSKIHLMATPLHSQNFINIKDGILTNNRRIVTKNMWFNGTELSSKARRALENENISIVVNNSGFIHTIYDDATISKQSYIEFKNGLKKYLTSKVSFNILANFLRAKSDLQKCFQYRFERFGSTKYVAAEVIFHYEHSSKFLYGTENSARLLKEIDGFDLYNAPIPDRLILNDLEEILVKHKLPVDSKETVEILKDKLKHNCYQVNKVIRGLIDYCHTAPRFPKEEKNFIPSEPIDLKITQSRDEIIEYLESIRAKNTSADLAFYTFRDINRSHWVPFLKAAFERNPVCVTGTEKLNLEECYNTLKKMSGNSIYDSTRMAQPDEVWNFKRGDGLEKAICLMTIIISRDASAAFEIKKEGINISLLVNNKNQFQFISNKSIEPPKPEDLKYHME